MKKYVQISNKHGSLNNANDVQIGLEMETEGTLTFVRYDGKSVIGRGYWNLAKDYDGQTWETKIFIGSLLGVQALTPQGTDATGQL